MIRLIVGVILTLLLITGCGAGSEEPAPVPSVASKTWSPEQGTAEHPGWPYPNPIDWAKYEPGLQQQIDAAAMKKDCATIDRLFGDAISFDGQNSEILTYIDRWGRHTNCPNFPEENEEGPDDTNPVPEPEAPPKRK